MPLTFSLHASYTRKETRYALLTEALGSGWIGNKSHSLGGGHLGSHGCEELLHSGSARVPRNLKDYGQPSCDDLSGLVVSLPQLQGTEKYTKFQLGQKEEMAR